MPFSLLFSLAPLVAGSPGRQHLVIQVACRYWEFDVVSETHLKWSCWFCSIPPPVKYQLESPLLVGRLATVVFILMFLLVVLIGHYSWNCAFALAGAIVLRVLSTKCAISPLHVVGVTSGKAK